MNRTAYFISAALAVVAAGAIWATGPQSSPPTQSVASAKVRPRQSARPAYGVAHLSEARATAREFDDAQPLEDDPEIAEVAEVAAPVTPQEYNRFLATAFAEQHRDARWSSAEEGSLHDAFASDALEGVMLDSAECRASMCRLELSLSAPSAHDVFEQALGQPPLDKGGRYHPTEDGGLVVYTAREAQPLPRPI